MARVLVKALAHFSLIAAITATEAIANFTGPYPCPYGSNLWCCSQTIHSKEHFASILTNRFNVRLQHTDYVRRKCLHMPFILQGQNTCTKHLACCEGPRSVGGEFLLNCAKPPKDIKPGVMRASTGVEMEVNHRWIPVGYGYGFGYGFGFL
ncbi:hypothetical protein DL98DRAFT_528838 [Cadophora sp. DSE1049]|nr:hypothetical protein DL98DRAFT_528838 [Cadophora sp. DSE1049]